jgi:UDP-2-acetamido-2,6-beta-L-arabino-hexul-4-ose reductase
LSGLFTPRTKIVSPEGYEPHQREPGTGYFSSTSIRCQRLFELTKSPAFGQVFVSTTKPGVTRGNHHHDSKIERFCLVQGKGLIRFRKIDTWDVIEYPVSDSNIQLVDIPPGYTHSIENVGESDMLVLFWANEIFDPNVPDTYFEKVLN